MQKQLFFIISLYLITYSFSADTDPCVAHEDDTTCKADTTNNCEWTATQASCAAATCTGLNQTECAKIASCKYATETCSAADACSTFTNISSTACGATGATYCVWTDGQTGSCDPVGCTTLTANADACTAAKGCAFTPAGGSCAKKGSNASGGDGGSTGSDSAFGLKTSLTLLIIGFLL